MNNRRSTARDLAQIAVFAALIAALGLPGSITIGSTGVPITLQTLGVMLAGGILGARKGFLAVAVFLVLATAGLPLLAGGRGGIGIRTGPSAGYLIGFLAGAVVIGLLTAWVLPRYRLRQGISINLLGGAAVIYLFGVTWLSIRTAFGPAITAVFAYLPGDVLKAVVAALVIQQVHRSYPGLITGTGSVTRPSRERTSDQSTKSAPASPVGPPTQLSVPRRLPFSERLSTVDQDASNTQIGRNHDGDR